MNQKFTELLDAFAGAIISLERKTVELAETEAKTDAAQAKRHEAATDCDRKRQALINAFHLAFYTIPDSLFLAINQFIKECGWVGDYPSGFWSNPADTDYEILCSTDDKEKAGEYNLNSDDRILHLSGKEQTEQLRPVFCENIPKTVLKKGTRSAVAEWAIEQGYVLPDLRCEEYIWNNQKEARHINPSLFKSLEDYRKQTGSYYLYGYFTGSIVRSADGVAYYSCLCWDGSDLDWGGDYLKHSWKNNNTLLVLKT